VLRALLVATLFFVSLSPASGQTVSVLHIKVVVVDAEGKTTPVPRHVLLISDNPATTTPRQVTTAMDGTADVKLRPGNYTVESDQPLVFRGKSYLWIHTLDIVAGRDAVLELTAKNAEVEATTAADTTVTPLPADTSNLLSQWLDSVVAVWTPTTHASAFLIDASGLMATNQRVVGTAKSVEVQLSPVLKVSASVLEADQTRDVAVLRIDPKVAASLRVLPLGCGQEVKPPVVDGQRLFAIAAPLREQKTMTSGRVTSVEANSIAADFRLASGGEGGPVLTDAGSVVGITSVVDEKNDGRRGASQAVRIDAVCDVVASAEKKLKDTAAPDGTPLPVEPARPFPVDALKDAAKRRAGNLSPYQMSSADFDVAFITPLMIYGAQQLEKEKGQRHTTSLTLKNEATSAKSPLTDFANWSEYVEDVPPVLLIRVTPRLVESFWTTVARGAARTQGVAVPPIKRFKSGFLRMRVYCGDAEVTPIHPFMIEQRVSETDAIEEGLYVFDPGALGPQCAAVKLLLYSEKEPAKGDTRVVDPKLIQQIWQDFAPYRQP
jgi:Trypsin-like peptidase domain